PAGSLTRMVKNADLPGSPSSRAILAPAGIVGGALVHAISAGLNRIGVVGADGVAGAGEDAADGGATAARSGGALAQAASVAAASIDPSRKRGRMASDDTTTRRHLDARAGPIVVRRP